MEDQAGPYRPSDRAKAEMIQAESNADSPIDLLLVDDSQLFCERLARAFTARGFQVRTAADYEQAMLQARDRAPQWAVVDLRMPGKSGLDLVRDLKHMDASIRVLVLTGFGSIATAVEAIRLGAANYLPKPADADDIIASFQREESEPASEEEADPDPKAPSLARAEWEHIHRVLSDCEGNISEAARRLGIHRRSLQRKLKKLAPE